MGEMSECYTQGELVCSQGMKMEVKPWCVWTADNLHAKKRELQICLESLDLVISMPGEFAIQSLLFLRTHISLKSIQQNEFPKGANFIRLSQPTQVPATWSVTKHQGLCGQSLIRSIAIIELVAVVPLHNLEVTWQKQMSTRGFLNPIGQMWQCQLSVDYHTYFINM